MKILITGASYQELEPIIKHYVVPGSSKDAMGKLIQAGAVDFLVHGIGQAFTTMHLSHIYNQNQYDLAIQAGICGSFNKSLTPGAVCQVSSECFSDLGAEDRDEFLDIFDLQLMKRNEQPFFDGFLLNTNRFESHFLQSIQRVKGITVNTVHGNTSSIENIKKRLQPDVESMEGAAFFLTSLYAGIPFIEIRVVSNFVSPRDRKAWKIKEAIQMLELTITDLIDHFLSGEIEINKKQ